MKAQGDGVYLCPLGHRWLDDSAEVHQAAAEAEVRVTWEPDGVSLSYVPGTVKGGGGRSRCGPSPAKQKQDAYTRRQMPGIHIRHWAPGAPPKR